MKTAKQSKTIWVNGAVAILSALVAALALVETNLGGLGLTEQGQILVSAGIVFVVTAANIILRYMTTEPIKKQSTTNDG